MVNIAEMTLHAVPVGCRVFTRMVRRGINLVIKLLKAAPAALGRVIHKMLLFIRWLFTEGLAFVANLLAIGISQGIPMLLKGIWNLLVGLITVQVALLGQVLR